MKKSNLFIALVIGLALLASCQPPTEEKKNPPPAKSYKLLLDLPASLTPQNTPAPEGETPPPEAGGASSAVAEDEPSYTSAGYGTLYSAISMVRQSSQSMGTYAVLFDALISQNNLAPSADTRTGLKIIVTQQLLDQIVAATPAGLVGTVSLPPLGEVPLPGFVYRESTNPYFDYELVLSDFNQTVYWNSTWSRFAISISVSVGDSTQTIIIANDTASKSAYFGISASGLAYVVKFKADAASSNHGVFVSLDMTMDVGDETYGSVVTGYGDDLGGAVNFTSNSFNGKYLYFENFNASGEVTYQAFQQVVDEVAGDLIVTVGAPDTTYDGKLANEDWGDAPTFFLP